MYSLNNIQEFEDENKYLIEQVDCVERPLFVAIKSYNEYYAHLYLMFLKLSQSYYLGNTYKSHNYSFARSRYILEKELDFKFGYINSKNLIEGIEKEINKNNPVLVLVNLKDIYYSNFFKKKDWIHLFLIRGYDKDKKLFYIMDNIHRTGDNDKILYDFVIQYDTLTAAYNSYCNNINNDFIYYIDSHNSNVNSKNTILPLLLKGINYYLHTDIKYYLNDENVQKVQNYGTTDLSKSIIKMDYYREVFFNELSILLTAFLSPDNNNYNLFNSKEKELVSCWKRKTSLRLFSIRKKKNILYDDVIEIEKEVRQLLEKITEDLLHKKEKQLGEFQCIKQRLVNNTDKIISFIDSRTIMFNFNTNKIYNNWFTDESPKVIYELDLNITNLIFETRIDFVSCGKNSDIIAGIYLKTIKNERYLWGSKSGQKMVFENTGIEAELLNIYNKCSKINLSINFSNDNLYLEYSDSQNGTNIIERKDISLKELKEIGIVCKTWNLTNKYLIKFSISKISVDNKILDM